MSEFYRFPPSSPQPDGEATASSEPAVARKLIVCIDGTSKKYSDKNTNVVELYSHIEKSQSQLTYYNSGIGTYAQPTWRTLSHFGQVINSALDAILARNIEKVIIGAYRWLSDHYLPGDEIFLFGFSRGAYQVRALAGMIETVGLIFPGNQEQIPFAFEMYAKYGKCEEDNKTYAKHKEEYRAKVSKFKATFSRERVSVKFLGAWDTVSSVGVWRGKLLPLTNECGHITHFRHALALDERRVKYIPEHITTTARDEDHIKEVWFAGTHSDVGGGNASNNDRDRSAESLIWMITEAKKAGLKVDARVVGSGVGKNAKVKDSLKNWWWICEVIPFSRLSNKSEEKRIIRGPNFGKGRNISSKYKIHYSVKASWEQEKASQKNKYVPKARLRHSDGHRLDWRQLFDPKETAPPQDWEGTQDLISALTIIRRAEEIFKPGEQGDVYRQFMNNIKKEDYAEMIWEYGGLPFLFKVADQLESFEVVQEIINRVIGIKSDDSKAKVSISDIPRLIDLLNSQNFHYLEKEKERSSTHKPPLQERVSRVRALWPRKSKESKKVDNSGEVQPVNGPPKSPPPQTPRNSFVNAQPSSEVPATMAPDLSDMDRNFLALTTTTQKLALIAVEVVIDIFEKPEDKDEIKEKKEKDENKEKEEKEEREEREKLAEHLRQDNIIPYLIPLLELSAPSESGSEKTEGNATNTILAERTALAVAELAEANRKCAIELCLSGAVSKLMSMLKMEKNTRPAPQRRRNRPGRALQSAKKEASMKSIEVLPSTCSMAMQALVALVEADPTNLVKGVDENGIESLVGLINRLNDPEFAKTAIPILGAALATKDPNPKAAREIAQLQLIQANKELEDDLIADVAKRIASRPEVADEETLRKLVRSFLVLARDDAKGSQVIGNPLLTVGSLFTTAGGHAVQAGPKTNTSQAGSGVGRLADVD